MIVTFDEHGISSHPNHIAIFEGVAKLMKEQLIEDLEVFTLSTVNVLRKYIAFADINLIVTDEWQAFRINVYEAY